MKQKNIERRARQKKEAMAGVIFFAVIMLVCAVVTGWACGLPEVPVVGELLLGALAGIFLLMIVPALVVLKKRFEEIEGGELDEASEY